MNLVDILQMSKADARAYLERVRWPNGVTCPRCDSKKVTKLKGQAHRIGLYKCRECTNNLQSPQFSVSCGTIFEDSHLPLNKWIGAFYLMCSSKKGISANQLHRSLGISYKSAWYMAHRIRLAMRSNPKNKLSGIVEADETYIGGKTTMANKRKNKMAVVALVERDGKIRTKAMQKITAATLIPHLRSEIDEKATLMTDQATWYVPVGKHLEHHEAVNHSKFEWARGNAHINTAESFFSLLKRGLYGSYHHVSKKHLFRYLDEFSFRFNCRKIDDGEALELALKGSEGKRLVYKEYMARNMN